MRRFERDGTEVCEVEVVGRAITVSTDGRPALTEVFTREEEARADAERRITALLEQGYAEVPAPRRGSPVEATILQDPDAIEAWSVHADWLVEQGDARGHLAHAQIRGEDAADLLARHRDALWGPFAPGAPLAPFVGLTWRYGYWGSARISHNPYEESLPDEVPDFAALTDRLLRHPSARFLRALTIGVNASMEDGNLEFGGAIGAIVAAGVRPSVQDLLLGDFTSDECEISWSTIGDVSPLLAVLPDLRRMVVHGGDIGLSVPRHARLTHLELQTGGLPAQPVRALATSELPSLETLLLWFGTENYGAEATPEDVRALVAAADRFPRLTSLGLMNSDLSDSFPALLGDSPLLPQLRRVDFSMGVMTDQGARDLLARADAYRHLESIDLAQNAIMDAGLLGQLRGALPMVHVGRQSDPRPYGAYVSVGE